MKEAHCRLKNAVICTMSLAFGVLAGCGGREAHPISLTNPHDSVMDCAGVDREFRGNERQIQAIIRERNTGRGKNIALGAAGVLFFPAWFFMDPKSPERVEIDALRNRNRILQDIAQSKKCPVPQSQLKEAYKQLDSNKKQ